MIRYVNHVLNKIDLYHGIWQQSYQCIFMTPHFKQRKHHFRCLAMAEAFEEVAHRSSNKGQIGMTFFVQDHLGPAPTPKPKSGDPDDWSQS